MARARFLVDLTYGNLYTVATSTIAATSEASGLPVTFSQSSDRSQVFRSATGTGVVDVTVDLGASRAVTGWAVANLKLVGSGVLELYQHGTGSSPGAGVLVATITGQDANRKVASAFFASVSARHWSMRWTNPGSDSDYAELGYAWLGTYFEPTVNFSVPMAQQLIDPSRIGRSSSRQRTVQRESVYFTAQPVFEDVPEADRDSFQAVYEWAQTATAIFIVLDTTRAWMGYLAWLGDQFQIGHGQVDGRYTIGVPFEEAA